MANTLLVKKCYTFQNLLVQNLRISLAVGSWLGDFIKNLRPLNILHDLVNFTFELIPVQFNHAHYIFMLQWL